MSTRQVLGAVGAVIGGYFYGAQGAQWGYAIGSTIGGIVDPEIIRGPRLGDIGAQTSQEGIPRPIVWAMSQPMPGNILAAGPPRIVRTRTRQGKGGGGPKVESESVFRTYAIGVSETVTRFVRVWENNTLVYDDSEFPLLNSQENAEFLKHARFFLGTWNQNASPDLEAIFGVGTTPAHRGTAYMVIADKDLTDLRGAIPQYVFQVERCEGTYLTSRPYALEDIGALGATAGLRRGYAMTPDHDQMASSFEIMGGVLYGAVATYNDGAPEAVDSSLQIMGGVLYGAVATYDDAAPEALDSGLQLVGGVLYGDQVEYNEGAPEALDAGLELLGGTLEDG